MVAQDIIALAASASAVFAGISALYVRASHRRNCRALELDLFNRLFGDVRRLEEEF